MNEIGEIKNFKITKKLNSKKKIKNRTFNKIIKIVQ